MQSFISGHASIAGIEYHLPEKVLTTEDLSDLFPDWRVEKIDAKTGIRSRHIAAIQECASDLAVTSARKLFASGVSNPGEIDFLLCCTQSPDYLLPATACLLQDRLGISTAAGALDMNLGCSGFVYGLGLAEGLIATGQARAILLITTDTMSKYMADSDKSARAILGDGSAATLLRARACKIPSIGPFVYGTDGSGGNDIILPNSATRRRTEKGTAAATQEHGLGTKGGDFLWMDGGRVFDFALSAVPRSINALLAKAGMKQSEIDLFVFHQANGYILEELRRLLGIEKHKFQLTIRDSANTTSSTIPIALKHAQIEGRLWEGAHVLVVGFGVGYSWSASIIRWNVGQ